MIDQIGRMRRLKERLDVIEVKQEDAVISVAEGENKKIKSVVYNPVIPKMKVVYKET